jgi:hypothetical protein
MEFENIFTLNNTQKKLICGHLGWYAELMLGIKHKYLFRKIRARLNWKIDLLFRFFLFALELISKTK